MIYAAIIWRSRNYNPAVKFPQKEIDTPRRRQTLCTPRPWNSRPTSHRAITLSVCLPASGRLYPDGFAVFAIGFVIGICEFALAIGATSSRCHPAVGPPPPLRFGMSWHACLSHRRRRCRGHRPRQRLQQQQRKQTSNSTLISKAESTPLGST